MRFSATLGKKPKPLDAPSLHATFESSRSNSNKSTTFYPKFDLSDIVHSLAIRNKPTERMGGVINVSYPKVCALSIDIVGLLIAIAAKIVHFGVQA